MQTKILNMKTNSNTSTRGRTKLNPILETESHDNYEEYEERPTWLVIICALVVILLTFLGWIRDLIRHFDFGEKTARDPNPQDFAPLYENYEGFFRRNIFMRVREILFQPIASTPGVKIEVMERFSDDYNRSFRFSGKKFSAINLGSYNYLDFARNNGPCANQAIESIEKYSITMCSTRHELGNHRYVKDLESLMAEYLNVEDCITFGMGFATNALNIPTLVGKGDLIISDKLNHASVVLGARLSKAVIRTFIHNDMKDLEKKLRESIVYGQPGTYRPWKKILIIVEGAYSMEGSFCKLREIVVLKKKYKAYLYIDEAHSIGAIGSHGRGVVDYWNINPDDIDIHMGTFTKSFGSAGGYIAGKKSIIDHIRIHSHSACYSSSISSPIAYQIIAALNIIMGRDGTDDGQRRIRQLGRNIRYFRRQLVDMGFIIYGNDSSPIIPLMIFVPTTIGIVYREMLKRGCAVACVGFPATALTSTRVRFCLSAGHTKEMLDHALQAIDDVGHLVSLRYSKRNPRRRLAELDQTKYDNII